MSENRGHGSEATESRTDERDGSRDRSAGRELQAQRTTHHDTTLLLAARQRMGQKLAERLIALQEQEVAAPIKQVRCCARRVKKVTVTSRLGKVTYERAYYYDPEERRGYYPFDQQLGVKGGISEGVVRIVVK
jgi:hypothetical protein